MRVYKLPHESRGHSERHHCSSPGRGQRSGGKVCGGGAVDTVKALAAASAPGSGRFHSFSALILSPLRCRVGRALLDCITLFLFFLTLPEPETFKT